MVTIVRLGLADVFPFATPKSLCMTSGRPTPALAPLAAAWVQCPMCCEAIDAVLVVLCQRVQKVYQAPCIPLRICFLGTPL